MVTEILSAVTSALGIAKPLVEEHLAQAYETDQRQTIADYQDILAESDPEKRRDRMGAFIQRLCIQSGDAFGRLSGTSIEVPVELFDSLVRQAIEDIKARKMLASAAFTLRNQS